MTEIILGAALLCFFSTLIVSFFIAKKVRGVGRQQRELKSRIDEIIPFTWSIEQMKNLLPDTLSLPSWNHWSLPPDTLHFVLQDVKQSQPKMVVEFGAGISTICIGAMLRQNGGGKLISIEHDREYATAKQQEVHEAGLSNIVEIRVAPISKGADTPFGHQWYAVDSIADLVNVDLVLVDGPPAAFGPEVRYPGVAYMVDRLSASGKIICDDTKRPGEIAIKSALLERFDNILVKDIPMNRGCYVVELKTPSNKVPIFK